MTIDINELRRLAQEALGGPDGVSLNWIKPLQDFQQKANPQAILELLDHLEVVESARRDDYQNWMTALDRNAELLAKLEAAEKAVVEAYQRGYETGQEEAEKERDALRAETESLREGLKRMCLDEDATAKEAKTLRAKVERMEKQEPVGKFIRHPSNGLWEQDGYGDNPDARPLYALPGAKGE